MTQHADLVADGVPRIVEPPSDVVAKPPTIKQRNRWTQNGLGYRPMNDWGSGDLPAPYAEGDMLWLPEGAENERMRGMTGGRFYSITYATSIDEGDAWYFRVAADERGRTSDRLHVAWAARSSFEIDVNWMDGFQLVHTADLAGLHRREHALHYGWKSKTMAMAPVVLDAVHDALCSWDGEYDEDGSYIYAQARAVIEALGLRGRSFGDDRFQIESRTLTRPTSAPAATQGGTPHVDGAV